MKKKALIMVFLFLIATAVPVEAKDVSILGGFGLTTAASDSLCIDLGIEFQLGGNFYLQLLANTDFGSDDSRYGGYYPGSSLPGSISYGWGGLDIGLGGKLYGLNVYGVFRRRLSNTLLFFFKGGGHFTFYSGKDYVVESGIAYYDDWSWQGLGAAAGLGLEYLLNERIGLLFGGTYKRLFNGEPPHPDSGSTSWFKIYTGINLRVQKSSY
ncbi:MAG: hypothetical protein GY757_61450 [bacterium]|nr:hypothetical protein [bacterium]